MEKPWKNFFFFWVRWSGVFGPSYAHFNYFLPRFDQRQVICTGTTGFTTNCQIQSSLLIHWGKLLGGVVVRINQHTIDQTCFKTTRDYLNTIFIDELKPKRVILKSIWWSRRVQIKVTPHALVFKVELIFFCFPTVVLPCPVLSMQIRLSIISSSMEYDRCPWVDSWKRELDLAYQKTRS